MFGLDFRFENTTYLYCLWLVPFVIGVAALGAKLGKRKLTKAIGAKSLPNLISSVETSKRRWKLILQALVIAFIALTLARPQMGQSKQEIKSEGVELMFVVDVSDSMLAEDVRPNRLEQAKTELGKLIDMMAGSKIGIVAFAGSAALLSPLTSDPASLRMYLESLSTNSVSSQGTVFKSAIEEAAAGFKRGGTATDETTKVTRVILLASDGEDHEQGALEAAKKLTDEGVRIFSLIYGTEKGAPIPERDGMGYLRGYKKDRSGQTVLTTVKGDALRAIAEAGRGIALHASFGGTHLQTVIEEINKLEKTQFDSTMAIQYDERFQFVAVLAFICLIIELLLGDRKNSKNIWQGRFHGTSSIAILITAGAVLLVNPAQAQVSPDVYFKNQTALKSLQSGQPLRAKDLLLQSLKQEPFSPELHFNLGFAYEALQQPDNAKASYQVAIEHTTDPAVLFSANFNLGLLAQKAKNKDQALKYYQQALKYVPDSKETKINIELLTSQSQQQKGDGEKDPQDQKGEGKSDPKDDNENKDDKQGDKDKDQPDKNKEQDKPKQYGKNKPQPQQFKSQELTEGDVKKILGEIKQQEQKIRAEFNKKETKEQPQEKDW